MLGSQELPARTQGLACRHPILGGGSNPRCRAPLGSTGNANPSDAFAIAVHFPSYRPARLRFFEAVGHMERFLSCREESVHAVAKKSKPQVGPRTLAPNSEPRLELAAPVRGLIVRDLIVICSRRQGLVVKAKGAFLIVVRRRPLEHGWRPLTYEGVTRWWGRP